MERYTKDVIGHTLFYKGYYREIYDVDIEEQLFMIHHEGEDIWVRPENHEYIPF